MYFPLIYEHLYVIIIILTTLATVLCRRDVGSPREPKSGDTLQDLGNMLESMQNLLGGAGLACVFQCPDGMKPRANIHHIPSSNGCGSMGVQLDTGGNPDMTHCCDDHDKCYDTCNSDRITCDQNFKRCLLEICEKHKKRMKKEHYETCTNTMDVMYMGTMALGCQSYKDAQTKACVCRVAIGHDEM